MKRIVAALLAVLMLWSLCACAKKPAAPAEEEKQEETALPASAPAEQTEKEAAPEIEAEPEPTADALAQYRTGSPWLCVDLEGIVTEDMPTDPKDNFALYANKDFYLGAVIPEGYNRTGPVTDTTMLAERDITALFDGSLVPKNRDEELALELYDLIMDWDARNALGVQPLNEMAEAVEAIGSIEELNEYFLNTPITEAVTGPFSVGTTGTYEDQEHEVGFADTPYLLMSDSAEYSARTEMGQREYDALHELAQKMFVKMGYSEAEAAGKVENGFLFDSMMAPYIYTSDDQNDPDYFEFTNNIFTLDEMLELQGDLPVVQYVDEVCGLGSWNEWLVPDPDFYIAMQELYTDENLTLIKDWMLTDTVIYYSDMLDEEAFRLSQQTTEAYSGEAPMSDELMAANAVSGMMPWAVSQMYCDTYFTEEDRETIQKLIDDVLATFKEMLAEETFISEKTKEFAIRKLENMTVRCCYPDNWEDYALEGLDFCSKEEGGTYWEALKAIAEYDFEQIKKSREEMAEEENSELWGDLYPTEDNCFYDPYDNSINILAAFCRGEVYHSGMSIEENYAKMGAVIGHEISHAFDSTGAQFDENGAWFDWWTMNDKLIFDGKVQKMADYLSAMTLWEGQHMNGDIMTGEACADMGGIACVLRMAKKVENFDYDLFFRSFANLWAEKETLFRVQMRMTDEHPMCYVRINTVLQQFDEFLDFYGIKEGDAMYLAPEDRVAIW